MHDHLQQSPGETSLNHADAKTSAFQKGHGKDFEFLLYLKLYRCFLMRHSFCTDMQKRDGHALSHQMYRYFKLKFFVNTNFTTLLIYTFKGHLR